MEQYGKLLDIKNEEFIVTSKDGYWQSSDIKNEYKQEVEKMKQELEHQNKVFDKLYSQFTQAIKEECGLTIYDDTDNYYCYKGWKTIPRYYYKQYYTVTLRVKYTSDYTQSIISDVKRTY